MKRACIKLYTITDEQKVSCFQPLKNNFVRMKYIFTLLSTFLACIPCMQAQDSIFTVEKAGDYLKNNCYEVQRWKFPWGMSTAITLNILSDDTHCNGADHTDRPELQTYEYYSYVSDNIGITNLWKKYYEGIKRCNILINSETPVTDITRKYIAEAKFLRALLYFEFVSLYGNVPINIDDEPFLIQSPKNDVYDFIIKDLKDAIPVLPLKSGLSKNDADRATKGAAQALLGKVYLYQEKWSEAITQLESVINSNEYLLLSKYEDLWIPSTKHCKESVYEITFLDSTMDWTGHNACNIDIQLMGPRYVSESQKYLSGWGFCNISNDLFHIFKDNKDSVRLHSTILFRDSVDDLSGPEYQSTEMYNHKYTGRVAYEPKEPFGYSQSEYVLRYADVLLMYAEAKYRLGDESAARLKLNMIRKRALLPDITSTGENLLFAIQNERRLELALENNRFFDLVRWNIASDVLGSLGYKSYNNILPIPLDVLKEYKSLKQNPGYVDPVGFTYNTLQSGVAVWPNPVVNEAIIKFSNKKSAFVNISLYTTEGRLVKKVNLGKRPMGEVKYRLQLTEVPNGIYSLEVSCDKSRSINKIAIIR